MGMSWGDVMKHELPPDFERRWRRRFEEFAGARDDDAGIAGWTPSGLETRLRNFLHHWPGVARDSLWLDIGCGAGTYTRLLAQEGARVCGIDYSLPSLAKARARSTGRDIPWFAADVNRLPVKPATADGVLCFGVLQAIAATEPALRSMAAALKPGGVLWVDILNAECIANILERRRLARAGKPTHLRYETRRAVREALVRAGFEDVHLYWLPILPARLARFQWLVETAPARLAWRLLPWLTTRVSHSVLVSARKRSS